MEGLKTFAWVGFPQSQVQLVLGLKEFFLESFVAFVRGD